MDLKIKKDSFQKLLRWTQGIVEKKTTMPVLSNVLLETNGKNLQVVATDLEIAVAAEQEAEIKREGKAVVNARSLYEIVKEAPEEAIHLTTKGESIEISSGKARFKILGMNPTEFPTLPNLKAKGDTKIKLEDLEEMIEKTFYAVSNDEARRTLNGLYLVKVVEGDKSSLRIVGTDGHRLAYDERDLSGKWKEGKGIILPRKGIGELKKLLSDGEGDLTASVDDKVALFHRGPVSLMLRLIDGEFPAYDQVIPKKVEKIVSVPKQGLLGALRRAAILTSDQGRGVRFSFSSGIMEVKAEHPDLGEVHEELSIDYKGGSFQVGFNPRYLLDVLSVLEDEKVILELKDEVSPCVIRSEFDRGFLALIMPMRI